MGSQGAQGRQEDRGRLEEQVRGSWLESFIGLTQVYFQTNIILAIDSKEYIDPTRTNLLT